MSTSANQPSPGISTPASVNGPGLAESYLNANPSYQQLQQECRRLRAELDQVKQDRDAYLKSIFALLPRQDFDFTKEELFSHIGKVPSWDQMIEELKRDPAYGQQS